MKTVLFDLDGTICDTIADLHMAINAGLTSCGYEGITYQQTVERLGNGIGKLFAASLPEGDNNKDIPAIKEAYRAYYLDHCCEKTTSYPGVYEVVKTLKERGYRLGVVTNKIEDAAGRVCQHYFPDLFELVIGELPGKQRKPDPTGIYMAIERLGVKLSDCIYVGDSEVDVKFAKNAGIPSILCCWGTRSVEQLQQAGATKIVTSAQELLEEIECL